MTSLTCSYQLYSDHYSHSPNFKNRYGHCILVKNVIINSVKKQGQTEISHSLHEKKIMTVGMPNNLMFMEKVINTIKATIFMEN